MPEDVAVAEVKTADKLASDRVLIRWIVITCIGGATYFASHMLGRDNKHSDFLETSIVQAINKLADNQTVTLSNQAQQIRDAADAARNLERLTAIAEAQSRTMQSVAEYMRDFRDDQRKFPAIQRANAEPEPRPETP